MRSEQNPLALQLTADFRRRRPLTSNLLLTGQALLASVSPWPSSDLPPVLFTLPQPTAKVNQMKSRWTWTRWRLVVCTDSLLLVFILLTMFSFTCLFLFLSFTFISSRDSLTVFICSIDSLTPSDCAVLPMAYPATL